MASTRPRLATLWLGIGLAFCACRAPALAPRQRPTLPAGTLPAPPQPVLRVGTSGDYAPFSNAGEGFDVEVARAFARDAGYRIEWVTFTWPELASDVEANAFDVAMSGVTWRPERAVIGSMSRAVAVDAPCVLAARADLAPGTGRVAVNRGGILEQWTRAHYPAGAIAVVDDNLGLPDRLARGDVDAIVTDRFELPHFTRPGWHSRCEPPRDRKVYWVAPARADSLRAALDDWLAAHEPRLRELRARWLGDAAPRDAVDHLVDLLTRRFELMPSVAAYKRAHGLPIEDPGREAVVLEQTRDAADAAGLDRASVEALFQVQMDLAKTIQARSENAPAMDLASALRPALSTLGRRILAALVDTLDALPTLPAERLDLLAPLLDDTERAQLLTALRGVRPAAAHAVAR